MELESPGSFSRSSKLAIRDLDFSIVKESGAIREKGLVYSYG